VSTLSRKRQSTKIHDTCTKYSKLFVSHPKLFSYFRGVDALCACYSAPNVKNIRKSEIFHFFPIFSDCHEFWPGFGHLGRPNEAHVAFVRSEIALYLLLGARSALFNNLNAIERRITCHSGRMEYMNLSNFA